MSERKITASTARLIWPWHEVRDRCCGLAVTRRGSAAAAEEVEVRSAAPWLKPVMILEEKWPILVRHERAGEWLRVWVDLGRAARTIDAYARGLAEFLEVCEGPGLIRFGRRGRT
ncbi:hypothetical protein [Plantactinospora endophytica]|uniref:Integrase n=1 Tax=Plantactinospora endophytica TaxID=673535 RepID=A0ABQ4EEE5_9ACTN|nr:hypothetical protein [Plantactinospora endophytica]GIG93093.1 hypothetical protein Pen02_80290 [Plantactinospora endophytica]